MFYVFNLDEWNWAEIKSFMHKNGGIPAPISYQENGWVKMSKGYILWNTERNGCAISSVSKSSLKQILRWARLPNKL